MNDVNNLQFYLILSFCFSLLIHLFLSPRFTFSVLPFSTILQPLFFVFSSKTEKEWKRGFSYSSSLSLFFSWMPPMLRCQVSFYPSMYIDFYVLSSLRLIKFVKFRVFDRKMFAVIIVYISSCCLCYLTEKNFIDM